MVTVTNVGFFIISDLMTRMGFSFPSVRLVGCDIYLDVLFSEMDVFG